MIHGLDGKKLSKRHGATAVGDYQHMGILPEAMLNFLALLGWSPGGDVEVMTVPQMIQAFSVEGLSKNAAVFDTKKLEWMNGQHLSMIAAAELAPTVVARSSPRDSPATASSAERADVVPQSHRSAQGSRAHGRRHGASGRAVLAGRHHLRRRRGRQDVEGCRRRRTMSSPRRARRSPTRRRGTRPRWKASCARWPSRAAIAAGKLFQPLRVALTGVDGEPGDLRRARVVGTRSVARPARRGDRLAVGRRRWRRSAHVTE